MIDQNIWNVPVIIEREIVEMKTTVKILTLLGKERIKITSEIIADDIGE